MHFDIIETHFISVYRKMYILNTNDVFVEGYFNER